LLNFLQKNTFQSRLFERFKFWSEQQKFPYRVTVECRFCAAFWTHNPVVVGSSPTRPTRNGSADYLKVSKQIPL